jgi:hypothetical protein
MYILFTGAPGSKWSSVVKNIYWSADIDHTDYSEARTYWHDADTPGRRHLMDRMWTHIKNENTDVTRFIQQNLDRITCPVDNFDLCRVLGIKPPGPMDSIHTHNYAKKDIKVYVYK